MACWKGYKQYGLKTKGGRKVPNCVPVKEGIVGAITNPIPKKFLKKASANQSLTKEDADVGFADASAPSNSDYQTSASPTQTAKKKMKKLKEYYYRNIVEADVCPSCNNTGMVKHKGNNILCPSCVKDSRAENPSIITKQAHDMLSKGKTTAVAEGIVTSLDDITPILEAYKASDKLKARTKYLVHPKLSKTLRDRLAARAAAPKKSKGYVASQSTLGLAAQRRAQMSHAKNPSPKGYPEEVKSLKDVSDDKAHKTPVRTVKESVLGTLGIAAGGALAAKLIKTAGEAHKWRGVGDGMGPTASRGYDKRKEHRAALENPKQHEFATSKEHHKQVMADIAKKRETNPHYPYSKPVKKSVKEEVGSGNFSTLPNQMSSFKNALAKKIKYSAYTPGKAMSSLSAKPMMGSDNNNRVSEETIDENFKPMSHNEWKSAVEKEHGEVTYQKGSGAKGWISAHGKNKTGVSTVGAYAPDQKMGYVHTKLKEDFNGEKVMIHSPGHRLHGQTAHVFHRFDDGRVNVQHRAAINMFKKGKGITNITLKPGEYKEMAKEAFLIDGSNPELKKITGGSKSVKRKYLGVKRGKTATGQPAHPIEVDPVIKTSNEINKVVK